MDIFSQKLMLGSDYQEGAHPNIIRRLTESNLMATEGYGTDAFCESARERIRQVCGTPDAAVQFLVGGTQTNATVIDALLASYQGVLAPASGHVSVHEAGAIEAAGHKVLALPSELGKITASQVETYVTDFWNDGNCEHMVMPGMVYLSQPTEFGTLYSKEELQQMHDVCRRHNIPLYIDGARLAYALASPANDVALRDLPQLCDVFYIGGTKCGALFGEAVVVPEPGLIPHFFTIIKQHGALLAKGRLLGIQFVELFRPDERGGVLYEHIGDNAVEYAAEIKKALLQNGYRLYFDSPTNQVFFIIENSRMKPLGARAVYSFLDKYNDDHTVIRFATSWATTKQHVEELEKILAEV